MTEETQQIAETPATTQQTDANVTNAAPETNKPKEGKKEKCRPMAKVVIRRLPPSMTQEQFLEQVSPLPDYDYMYFAKADMSLGQYAFSRAYIDFVDPQEIFAFREKFDNYVFVDAKGTEYPAVVEYAPFQRVPKKRLGKKKDLKCGTIESDPYYINFLETLKNQEADSTNAQPKTEYSFQPSDPPKKVTTTPLLDFLKQRKQEKQRLRDEKREEKRRRDMERKRSKDEPMISKVLKNIEEKDRDKDRDFNRENKENKDDKDKPVSKDLKNKKKEDRYRDKMAKDRDTKPQNKNYKDREDRNKEREAKQSKKHEDKKFHNKKDDHSHTKDERLHDKEEVTQKERRLEEKRGKSYEKMRQEKKRLAETQKKLNNDLVADEVGDDNLDNNENQNDCMNEKDDDNRSKQKNRKSSDNSKGEDKTDASEKSSEVSKEKSEQSVKEPTSQNVDSMSTDEKLEEVRERLAQTCIKKDDPEEPEGNSEATVCMIKKSPTKVRITKRRSSLESGGDSGSGGKSGGSKGTGSGSGSESRDDSSCLRRHKSLDGGNDSNLQKNESDDKDRDKKDPRTERRIRNKDRPAMEIYRPGMGRFSKQRLEREKGTEERATPSQSPTPQSGNSNTYKSGKATSSEVRSMTFKRSVSRDIS